MPRKRSQRRFLRGFSERSEKRVILESTFGAKRSQKRVVLKSIFGALRKTRFLLKNIFGELLNMRQIGVILKAYLYECKMRLKIDKKKSYNSPNETHFVSIQKHNRVK